MNATFKLFTDNPRNQLTCVFDEPVFASCFYQRSPDYDLKVEPSAGGQRLQVISYTSNPNEGFCKAGCFIQKLNYNGENRPFNSRPDSPTVSCIILMTFNDLFVRQFLIPSIVANTSIPYEIIVVYNGAGADLACFDGIKVIESETGCVSKAYNKGVAAARGKFIAIFHDDSLVISPNWHERMIEAIDEHKYYAVSTESVFNSMVNIEFLKGTPLFMEKTNYEKLGGHDELMFMGFEDLDFSYRIQRKGFRIKKISIPYRHFDGMSTVILCSESPAAAARLLFGYCLLPQNVISKWRTKLLNDSESEEWMYALSREWSIYGMRKLGLPPDSDNSANIKAMEWAVQRCPVISQVREKYEKFLKRRFYRETSDLSNDL
jgi:glycosyltransferase involved in cell wall biosynthesis